MILSVRSEKSIPPNVFRRRKSTFNSFYNSMALVLMIKVPFGLTNASAEFQRFMETCLFDISDELSFPYLDDVTVSSEDFRSHLDHLDHLWIVSRRLKKRGMKINPAKYKFFQKKVNFLGRVITIHDLQHLLGLLGYYWRYVKNFSKVAYPLFKLPKKDQINNKPIKPTTTIAWKEEHQQSLQRITDILTNPPTLSYPDFSSLFMLHVDASSKGLDCALYHKMIEELKYWVMEVEPLVKLYKSIIVAN